MRKILFIINPVAGNGQGKVLIRNINTYMDNENLQYLIKISNKLGNITELAKWGSRENYTDIVVVGGDGSLVEAMNGIDLEKEIRLGVIPAGTGNDFARMLNVDKDYIEALKIIIRGETKSVDIGIANSTKFINVCCCGIDGEIIMDTDRIKNKITGSTAYLLSTIKNLATYRAKKVIVNIDGMVLTREVILIAIGNGQYVGGGMKVTPGAVIDDGQFEICIINKLNKIKLLALFPSIFKGTHVEIKPVVEIYKGKKIEIQTIEDRLMVNADGNIIGTTPLKISLIKQKIQFIGNYSVENRDFSALDSKK